MTPEDREFYEQNGYLNGIRVHDEAQNLRVRRLFDELEEKEGREQCQIGLLGRHMDVPFLWELATVPAILDAIEALIGPDILLLSTHCFCKYPQAQNDEKFVAWHQDVTYWGLEPACAVTAWYAIDDSDVQNGCMRVIPGSHRGGLLEHGKSERAGNLLSINQAIPEAQVDESRAVDLILKGGEISIHDGLSIHASSPNRSPRRRCGFTVRFAPPHVKPVAGNSMNKPWPAVCVRGEDRYQHFGQWKPKFALPTGS